MFHALLILITGRGQGFSSNATVPVTIYVYRVIWAHFLRRCAAQKTGLSLQFLSPCGASGISALSLARLKMASIPFLALGFCKAKT
jgi:hypothetical protein